MALTKVGTTDLTGSLANTISEASTTAAAAAAALPPKIANVQIANSSWSVLDDTAVDITGGYVIINGSEFDSGCVVTIDGTAATTVTLVSSTVLRVEVPAKAANSYTVYVVNPDGGTAIKLNGLTYSPFPAWSTSTTLTGGATPLSVNISLSASEGADTISYANVGALPAGLSLAANGLLTGTLSPAVETTYSFVVKATDAENQDANRTFSVTVTVPSAFGGTYAGNTVNVGIETYGMFYSTGIKAGNNIIINAGIAYSACTFGSTGQFATIVAYNKQGNVVWSKSHAQDFVSGDYSTRTTVYAFHNVGQLFSGSTSRFVQHCAPCAIDDNDNVYFAFNTKNTSGANNSAWIVKYNSSGTRQWINRLRNNYTPSFPLVSAMSIDANNNLIVGLHRNSYGDSVVYQSNTMVYQDSEAFLIVANTADGSILKQIDLNVGHIFSVSPIPNTNKIVTSGAYYGYASLGVSNTLLLDSYTGLAGKRIYSNTSMGGNHPAILTHTAVHSNGAVFALGTTNNSAFLSIFGYSNTDLNSSTNPSWLVQFANGAGKQWLPGAIALNNNYVYAIASETGTNLTTSVAYVFRFHAGNGAINYQKSLTANNATYPAFVGTSIDVKGDNMYITGVVEEANTASGRSMRVINLVLPSNGYSNSSSSANIQFDIPSYFSNNKILYLNSSLTPYGSNTLQDTDAGYACTFIAYLATASNNMVSNTTADSIFALSDTSSHYAGDSSGGYYRAAIITNASSNSVTLSFS